MSYSARLHATFLQFTYSKRVNLGTSDCPVAGRSRNQSSNVTAVRDVRLPFVHIVILHHSLVCRGYKGVLAHRHIRYVR
jgi:hypothetical protein